MQQRLMRDLQGYGPLIGLGRVSPRVVQIGSMIQSLDEAQPPLPPANIRGTESQLHVVAQQRDLAMSLAREVGAGQS